MSDHADGPVDGQRYDVVVVGGGAAGLAGATALARSRRSVLVVDAGAPRNAPAHGVHNYLALEGVAPADLLAAGRAEVAGYGGELVDATAVTAERLADSDDDPAGGGFRVVLDDGRAVGARRLLVTTGLVDELPDVPGLAERWGRDVLHCPFCHGFEVRDRAIGVLATSPMAVHAALLWRQLSDDVVLFLHTAPDPGEEQWEQLAARGVAVVDGEVTGLVVDGGGLSGVRLAGGRVVPREALAVATRMVARDGVLTGLGLQAEEFEAGGVVLGSRVPSGPTGTTAVPGVWVAGNVTDPMAQVAVAAAAGLAAGAAVNGDLVTEDAARAVAARRAAGGARAPFSATVEREVHQRVAGGRRHGLVAARVAP